MDRRDFVKGGAAAMVGAALTNGKVLANSRDGYVIENQQIAWHLQRSAHGIRSVSFENRLSGRHFLLRGEDEFRLIFAAGARVEIPWWDFCLTDGGQVASEHESGLTVGLHRGEAGSVAWKAVNNLAGGQKGRHYDGYGWFRKQVVLPESARGQEIVFVLGGYDQQDWNRHWIYVNGQEIGHREVDSRWRTPGRYSMRPTDPHYTALRFGKESPNLLAVRTKSYDFHFEELPPNILDRIVFHPWLFDQYVSIGAPDDVVSSFELVDAAQDGPSKIQFHLKNAERNLDVIAHYEVEGCVRRKWLEVMNHSAAAKTLLDIEVDAFQITGQATEGGQGTPIFVESEVFLGLEHPAGVSQNSAGSVRLWHCPGRSIDPSGTLRSQASIVGVSNPGEALDAFHAYIVSRSPRANKKHTSLYTCYGINNQWGGCSALSDDEVIDCQRVVKSWQSKGVKLDYFTLDQGWPSNDGDLTEFAIQCYPDGPRKIIDGISGLGMKFGLWFAVSEGGWSNGESPAVQSSAIPQAGASGGPPTQPPTGNYRNGFPVNFSNGRPLCIASDPYFRAFKSAIERQVRDDELRLVKFDMGSYYCNSTAHEHLPGKYSSEASFDRLLDVASAARAIAPDVFIVWYWGVGDSPFWGLYGDTVFESGLFLEGSGTSWAPSLYYRDSVTLALDQSTRFAKFIPPLLKDSLGIWLSQIRWANFMGKHRWREAMIMDLGRGNLIFPQIWGDPNLLNDDDLKFLAEFMALLKDNEALFLRPRRDFGDVFRNEPYAYAFCEGSHGFIFCNNVHFAPRSIKLPLGRALGLSSARGRPLHITSRFPERSLLKPAGGEFMSGSTAEIWLRPFETLLLEVGSPAITGAPERKLTAASVSSYGSKLALTAPEHAEWMDLKFADAARLENAGMTSAEQPFASRLPKIEARSILAVHVRLQKGNAEYRHSPFVAELVQIRARIGQRSLPMSPTPDGRQYGNTQNAGCSWVVYQGPISPAQSNEDFMFSVHTYLPSGVEAITEAWIVKEWWSEEHRPEADGHYGDAPS